MVSLELHDAGRLVSPTSQTRAQVDDEHNENIGGTQDSATPTTVKTRATSEVKERDQSAEPRDSTAPAAPRSWRFWLIFLSLCLALLVVSLDITIMAVALPTIAQSVEGAGEQYVWITSSFLLASTVVQPFVGQVANIFGRRWPMLISVALFILGSGIIGGAKSVDNLIAGRTVQGLGGGGMSVLVEIIVCDLVSLRERGKYFGMVLSAGAVGSTLGPIIGGIIAEHDWRWIFYMNLPLGGACLVIQALFLRVTHRKEKTWRMAVARIDYVGGFLFIASISAILLGIVMGGTIYPWKTYHIIVPIVLGFMGWIAFHIYEWTTLCREPSVPPHLFGKPTSFIGFFLGFDAALLLLWICIFLPVYFQGVLGTSPLTAGVYLLPFMLLNVPSGMVAGGLMAKFGQYRPFHWVGFGFSALGFGLFTLLGPNSSKAAWAGFEIIASIGLGILMITVLPAIQASLSDADNASSAALFSFMRNFGFMWGITIPAIIFNNETDKLTHLISDADVAASFAGGNAYSLVAGDFVRTLAPEVRKQVVDVLTRSLKPVWYGGLAFSLLGFVLSFFEKHVAMRTELDTEYGLETKAIAKDIEL